MPMPVQRPVKLALRSVRKVRLVNLPGLRCTNSPTPASRSADDLTRPLHGPLVGSQLGRAPASTLARFHEWHTLEPWEPF